MMKLKMSPDIIYTVTKLYAGNKSTEMLECLIEFGQMENGKKLEFSAAASEEESISTQYNKCLAASLFSQEYVQHLKDLILEGTEAKTRVIGFHKRLITTTNDEWPSIDILSDDDKYLKIIINERKLLLGKIAIQQVLGNDAAIVPIEQRKLEIESRISIIISMFTQIKADVLAECWSTAATQPNPYCADWNKTHNSTEHYQKLLFLQRHKCVGTYFMRKNKRPDGTEYGQPYCRFGFPLHFSAHKEFYLMKLQVVVLDIISSVSTMIH